LQSQNEGRLPLLAPTFASAKASPFAKATKDKPAGKPKIF